MKYLFIGGAPKCGTGTLFNLLSSHPKIEPSRVKETFYFLDDTHPLKRDLRNQSDLFVDYFSDESSFYRLEATTHLLYIKNIDRIKASLQDIKVIFILRDPGERILSSFNYTKYTLGRIRTEFTFSNYVDILLNGNSNLDMWVNSHASNFILSNELTYSDYTPFLDNWTEKVERKNIMLIEFNELQDLSILNQKLCRWLSLEPIKTIAQVHRNPTIAFKSQVLHKALKPLNFLSDIKVLRSLYLKINSRGRIKKSDLETKALSRLANHFKKKKIQLSNIYGLDTSTWGE